MSPPGFTPGMDSSNSNSNNILHSTNNNNKGGTPVNLLSREVLTRGFNSFDDNNLSGYIIDEKELLDLETMNSPDLQSSMVHTTPGAEDLTKGIPGATSGSLGFSTTPSQPIASSNNNSNGGGNFHNSSNNHSSSLYANNAALQYGTPPRIQESTSPFDDFMLSGNMKQQQPAAATPQQAMWAQKRQQQQEQQIQQPQQPGLSSNSNIYSPSQVSSQYGMTQISSPPALGGPGDLRSNFSPPHALRFLQDYGIHSNMSSPAGSLGSHDTYNMSPSAKPPTKMSSNMAHSMEDKQQLLLAERRRRRRESHNVVERRRRDNINERIQDLASLVPESLLYNAETMGSSGSGPVNLTKDGKPNKGTILSRSVDYIRHLQAVIDEQNRRELEMQDLTQALQRQLGIEVTEYPHTSAELALAKFRGGLSEGGLSEEVLSPDMPSSGSYAVDNSSNSRFTPDYPLYSND